MANVWLFDSYYKDSQHFPLSCIGCAESIPVPPFGVPVAANAAADGPRLQSLTVRPDFLDFEEPSSSAFNLASSGPTGVENTFDRDPGTYQKSPHLSKFPSPRCFCKIFLLTAFRSFDRPAADSTSAALQVHDRAGRTNIFERLHSALDVFIAAGCHQPDRASRLPVSMKA